MKRTACLFPGQGAQFKGMAKELKSKWFLRVASDVLGLDILRICLEGSEEELKKPSIAQPSILAVSFTLFSQQKNIPDTVAGHSLGEYTALCAARSIDFRDAVRLARLRGLFMEEADGGRGGMLAVIGEKLARIRDFCKEEGIEIANFNSPNQLVVAVAKERVPDIAAALSKKEEVKKVVPLEVSGAFHSKAMIPAQEKLKLVIANTTIREPAIRIVFNVTADYERDPEKIRELMIRQLVSPVLWEGQVRRMIADGVEEFTDMWPQKILEPLVKAVKRGIK